MRILAVGPLRGVIGGVLSLNWPGAVRVVAAPRCPARTLGAVVEDPPDGGQLRLPVMKLFRS
jgi:hypothetical protein